LPRNKMFVRIDSSHDSGDRAHPMPRPRNQP
jgi:hypothetical protein